MRDPEFIKSDIHKVFREAKKICKVTDKDVANIFGYKNEITWYQSPPGVKEKQVELFVRFYEVVAPSLTKALMKKWEKDEI